MSSGGAAQAPPRRLLVRHLAQLATPAAAPAPLRGRDLGAVEVLEDAYVLCEDGRVSGVGRMRDLPPLIGEVEELDARGLCAIPGLADCPTHACFGGDLAEEFSPRAAGASYEAPPAAGGWSPPPGTATRAA